MASSIKEISGRKQLRDDSRFLNILDAAAKVFRKKGYYQATISDIANEIGIKKGSLYHYITKKEDLLYGIIKSALSIYINSLKGLVVNEKPADCVLQEAVVAHMQPIDIHFDQIYVFLNEMEHLSPEYRKEAEKQLDDYEKLWVKLLETGKMQGIFRHDLDSKITMLWIFGMCNYIVRWYKPGKRYHATELAEIYARNILHGIRR